MKECLVTGARGFVGSHLTEKLDDFTSIPHEEIDTVRLGPYQRFFFLSTYGNMAEHDNVHMIVKANVLDLTRINMDA